MFPDMTMTIPLAEQTVKAALRALGKRHSVQAQDLLDERVREQFTHAVKIASQAFLHHLEAAHVISGDQAANLPQYLCSRVVTDEVSKLLDPGEEVFDVERLADQFQRRLSDMPVDASTVAEAWGAFLKAFSFALRSAPQLREFLRASCEASSFSAMSDLREVLGRIESAVDRVGRQVTALRVSAEEYSAELSEYREWALTYARS